MQKARRAIPTVTIPSGNRTVQQSWEISLQGRAAFPGAMTLDPGTQTCVLAAVASHDSSLAFEWSVDPSGPGLDLTSLPQQFLATRNSAQLVLPANFLKVSSPPCPGMCSPGA